ncbi:MAG: hypothetical protein WDN31_00270 [Hyphomicrobium sp.]
MVLTVEGATFVEDDVSPLAHAYELGVRSIQLVHYIETRSAISRPSGRNTAAASRISAAQ